jgi:hypothetical protein
LVIAGTIVVQFEIDFDREEMKKKNKNKNVFQEKKQIHTDTADAHQQARTHALIITKKHDRQTGRPPPPPPLLGGRRRRRNLKKKKGGSNFFGTRKFVVE